jgi:hypothetical protein
MVSGSMVSGSTEHSPQRVLYFSPEETNETLPTIGPHDDSALFDGIRPNHTNTRHWPLQYRPDTRQPSAHRLHGQ